MAAAAIRTARRGPPDGPLRRRSTAGPAALVAFVVLVAASCGGGDTASPATTSTPTTGPADATTTTTTTPSQSIGRGVTDDEIHVGFIGLDFDALRSLGLVDIDWGDFALVVEALVDDVNAGGGIDGRRIVPHVELVSPVDAARADEVCLRLTEDVEVFAVLGGFGGPTASANACFTTQHDTILIGGSPTPEERAAATAPWLSTTAGAARHLPAAIRLLHDGGWFGERVGLAWDQTEQDDAERYFLPTLAGLGITPVETFVQGTEGGDAIEGRSEWQVISERVALAEIDTMVLTEVTGIFGLQQLVANGYDGQLLVVDTLGNTAAIGTAHIVPLDRLDGIVGTGFLDADESWEQESAKTCRAAFEAATGITVSRSDMVEDGEPNWAINIAGVCNNLRIFVAAAAAAGDVLNNETFLAGVHRIGDIEIVGRGAGFLGEGRYDAANEIRLIRFDNEDLPDGGLEPIGPMTPIDDILG